MKKTVLRQIIREIINESRDYTSYTFNRQALRAAGISSNDIDHISDIYNDIAAKTGDTGSCVLGNGIKINNKMVITSYSQGSIGLERIQAKIIPYLKSKYPKLNITYSWGNMD